MARIPINDDENDPANQAEEMTQDDVVDPETAPVGDSSNEIIALRTERDQLYQRLARAQADFQNSRRRLEADKEQALQYANSTVIKSLLPVIDNFERALAVDAAKTDAASIQKGLQLVHDQMMSVLKSQNVEEIAPAAGTPFDPNQHQALMQQPSDKYTEPTVTQLLQKGYALHGRTLRPAQVAVSKTS
ncbi:MAG TPA: nucleotide exchange factor GrpE [Tepidisphaeraceae bacterium]|nr:nucleotide exchange factor GrpE [Tepidisphaeraceae bacterium]